jgi:ATP/maltotriose-dependent transcriptional regulator MalT
MASETISKRRLQVIRLIATGITDQQIADTLNITVHTAQTHVKKIRHLLKVPSPREQLVKSAKEYLNSIKKARA